MKCYKPVDALDRRVIDRGETLGQALAKHILAAVFFTHAHAPVVHCVLHFFPLEKPEFDCFVRSNDPLPFLALQPENIPITASYRMPLRQAERPLR